MTEEQMLRRRARAQNEPLVVAPTEDGYRVYSATEPKNIYLVSGIPNEARCTCPDFEYHQSDSDWCCKHILAVLERHACSKADGPNDTYDTEERAAIQTDGQTAPERPDGPVDPVPNGHSQMLLKRSVSPDGRIDSLSVEFSCPVDALSSGDITSRAKRMLALQAGIATEFMGRNGRPVRRPPEANNGSGNSDGGSAAVSARLLDIGGYDGRWGRRLFINVRVNGRTMKLFGSKKQLEHRLAEAGYGDLAEAIEEGAHLNLPCRVTTKPSNDGRFTNIDRIFPIGPARPVSGGPR